MHIFHACSGILAGCLTLIFAFFFALLYFDGIYNETKVNSKKNNRSTLSVLIYCTILVIVFNFSSGEDYKAVLIVCFALGALITFYLIHTISPFNHP